MHPTRVSVFVVSVTVAVLLAVLYTSCTGGRCPGDTPHVAEGGATVEPPTARLEPSPAYMIEGGSRTFSVTYTAQVRDIPPGTKQLRVWIPLPRDTTVQEISELSFDGAAQPTLTTEKRFGNRLAYYEIAQPAETFETRVSYTVKRLEARMDLERLATDGPQDGRLVSEFLEPDRLVIVDDRIQALAAAATAGKLSTLERAKALYDYVASNMAYDKSGTGWGRGDTSHACDVGKGNCTDFHSLFISLARAEGIAAGFGIGLFPPYERYEGEKLGGYHCWAYFRVPGKSWVPVDISEGWKEEGKRLEFFFGNHTSNRVTLSMGRDLVLEPAQAGAPLNYMLAPHAEADGTSVPTSKAWTMEDRD